MSAGQHRGMTIIEVAIALMLGLIAIAFVIGIYQLASSQQTIGQAQQNLSIVRNGVKRLFNEQRNYNNVSNSIANNAGIVPEPMIAGGGDIRNQWDGAVTLQVNGSNPTQFDIVHNQVPQDACIEFATFSGDTWEQVAVGGTPVDGSAPEANSNCADTNTITFTSS